MTKLPKKIYMRKLVILFSLFFLNKLVAQPSAKMLNERFVLVIHGGAGTILTHIAQKKCFFGYF